MRKLTTEQFIEKSRNLHGDIYDYSHVNYTNAITNVEIICSKHGSFFQLPSHHMAKTGCPECGKQKINRNRRFTQQEFLDKIKDIPNLSFEKTIYKDRRSKVIVTCKIHGDYETTGDVLLKGSGCKKCASIKLKSDRLNTTDEFIKKAKKIHGDLYDYSEVKYKGSFKHVYIKCKKHNDDFFIQTPAVHLKGSGCPLCRSSKGELLVIEILQEFDIKYITQQTFRGCTYIRPLKFDFYLPKYNCCIEFDGEQHFKAVNNHWGGQKEFEKRKIKDGIKNLYCEQNNIPLLRIKYDETNIKQKIKQFITKFYITL
jgi:predicted RNA-binding Zn-ribbon protein involved in translation (DUF1610 family)